MDEEPQKPPDPTCWCVWMAVADDRRQILAAVHATRAGAEKAYGASSVYTIIEWDLGK